ncbi:XRE family transcriptional regulator [Sphingobium yanoikuyae]|uniref:XRE family transcriptional regulator n=1 Tax=Sphingobium yanoikuyae TaxID=13690 RepID=UPI00242DFBF3|nr:S24 family peptidase [Sphingobium yanoikuyae]
MQHLNRISTIRKARGMSQTELAEAIGTTLSTLGKLERGDRRLNMDWLQKISAALDVRPEVLITESSIEEAAESFQDDDDDVRIQQWDIAYGMGGGTFMDLPVTGEAHRFSRSWLRQFTQAPADKVFLATGTGDSMTPTIHDADIVLVDTTQREVRMVDRIWAAAYGQTGIIKRLRPMPDGSVKILSDNPSVTPETAYDGELHIVGRVVAIVRRM